MPRQSSPPLPRWIRPKVAARQREQRVATEQELFIKSDQQKRSRPERGELRHARAVQHNVAKIKSVQSMQRQEQQSNPGEAPRCAHPERLAERLLERQAIG